TAAMWGNRSLHGGLARPTPQHQVSEEQEQSYTRTRPPGFLPASPFSRRRRVKPLNTLFDFVGIEHFATGLFRQPAKKCHVRFQLSVFLWIRRDVRNRGHSQRRFTRFPFGIHREKVNPALRRSELSLVAARRGLVHSLVLSGLIRCRNITFELQVIQKVAVLG